MVFPVNKAERATMAKRETKVMTVQRVNVVNLESPGEPVMREIEIDLEK